MVAVIVEGKRDVTFFNNFIANHLTFDKKLYKIIQTKGKSKLLDKNFDKYLELKEDVKLNRIKKVLFIMDSDNPSDNPDIGGFENSKTYIEKLIEELGIKDLSSYCIVCNPISKEGNIEDLVISTLDKDICNCIKSFSECSNLDNNEGKRLLGIYNYGYPQKPFDFNHQNFNELKSKLQWLFEE